jgi:hypothetical protein
MALVPTITDYVQLFPPTIAVTRVISVYGVSFERPQGGMQGGIVAGVNYNTLNTIVGNTVFWKDEPQIPIANIYGSSYYLIDERNIYFQEIPPVAAP